MECAFYVEKRSKEAKLSLEEKEPNKNKAKLKGDFNTGSKRHKMPIIWGMKKMQVKGSELK